LTKWKLKRQEVMMNETHLNFLLARGKISGKVYGIKKAAADATRKQMLANNNGMPVKKYFAPMPEHVAYKRRNKKHES